VRAHARGALQHGHDYVLDLIQQDRRWPTRPRLIMQAIQSPGDEPGRYRSTVEPSTPRSSATCLFVSPSAQASTIFARSARNWAVRARRDSGDQLGPLRICQDQFGFGRPTSAAGLRARARG
jgi:hypothetical protein